MVRIDADTQDVYADEDGAQTAAAKETIFVKGRAQPFLFDRVTTSHGVVIASDRGRHQIFTIRWSGSEPGAAPELASLAIDRAHTWPEFRSALERWKMPARRVVYADAEGNIAFQDAALIPIRQAREWHGWRTIDDLPHAFNPPGGAITASEPRRREAPAVDAEALFAHPLAVTAVRRQRFNIGPIQRPERDDSPVRAELDARDWDRSRAVNAPGQSGSPASPHFADLAKRWSSGDLFQLAFTDAAVQAQAAATLTLVNVPGAAPLEPR
jgi:acyl-homoserine lactone acylase PvdQ